MALHSKITSKGQTTIPIKVRKALGLKDGDEIGYILDEKGARIVPKTLSVDDLDGVLGPPPKGKAPAGDDLIDAIDRAVEDLTTFDNGDRDPGGQT